MGTPGAWIAAMLVLTFWTESKMITKDLDKDIYYMVNFDGSPKHQFLKPMMICFSTPIKRDGIVFAYSGQLMNLKEFSYNHWSVIKNNEKYMLTSKIEVRSNDTSEISLFYVKELGKRCIQARKGDYFCFSSTKNISPFGFADGQDSYGSIKIPLKENEDPQINEIRNVKDLAQGFSVPMGIFIDINPPKNLKKYGDYEIECPDTRVPWELTTLAPPVPSSAPGATGATGPVGATGTRGENGEKGSTGEKGKRGRDGKDGAKGSAGEKGDRGDDGSDGKNGAKGEKGDKGSDGKDGKTGAVGARGPKGADGINTGKKIDKGFWGSDNISKYLAMWLLMLTIILMVVFGMVLLSLSRRHKCKQQNPAIFTREPSFSPPSASAYKPHYDDDDDEVGETNPEWMNSLRTEEVTDYDIARVTGVTTSPKKSAGVAPSHTGTLDSEYANIGARSTVSFDNLTVPSNHGTYNTSSANAAKVANSSTGPIEHHLSSGEEFLY